MEQQTEIKDESGTVFRSLLGLQSETYEFILRSLAMDEWLKRAYTMSQEQPDWTAERTYESWQHAFGHVYTNLFAMFFRPHRIMMFPLNPFSRDRMETITASSPSDMYLDMFTMWGDAQSRMMKGFASAMETYGDGNGKGISGIDQPFAPDARGLSPIGLMKNLADEQSRTYLESFELLMQYVGESQFLMPKEFFGYLQQLLASYPKAYQAGQQYEAALHSTWDRSLKRFAVEVKKVPDQKMEFKEFFESYIAIFGEEYDRLLRTPEFNQLQSSLVAITSDTISASEKMMGAQLEMFPTLPFAPRKEMDTLAERVQSYKRRLNNLERKVRSMETESSPPGNELEQLARRVSELELELASLPRNPVSAGTETETDGQVTKAAKAGSKEKK